MQRPFPSQKHSCLRAAAAAVLASVALAGCACVEADLGAFAANDAEVAGSDGSAGRCALASLESWSTAAAELVGLADPELLAEARRDAELECRERG